MRVSEFSLDEKHEHLVKSTIATAKKRFLDECLYPMRRYIVEKKSERRCNDEIRTTDLAACVVSSNTVVFYAYIASTMRLYEFIHCVLSYCMLYSKYTVCILYTTTYY